MEGQWDLPLDAWNLSFIPWGLSAIREAPKFAIHLLKKLLYPLLLGHGVTVDCRIYQAHQAYITRILALDSMLIKT